MIICRQEKTRFFLLSQGHYIFLIWYHHLHDWWWDFNCIITYHRLVFRLFMSCLYHLNAIMWIRPHFLAVFPALNLPMAHQANWFCCFYCLEKNGTSKQVKGDPFCFFIFLFFNMLYTCAFKRSSKLQSLKSALTGAPLSNKKHCSWNASWVAPPLFP